MTEFMMALVIGVLLGTGTYLLLQRTAIRLILGIALWSHGVNLLLFSGGGLKRGLPPIILDKTNFAGEISPFVDPLPQALILTAIVISFGITSFIVVLVNRRNSIVQGQEEVTITTDNPFAIDAQVGLNQEEDYEFLEDSLILLPRQQRE